MSSEGSGRRSRSLLGRDLVISIAGVFGTRVFQALAGILVARLLGPTLRGEYALVALAVATAGAIATLGLEFWIAPAIAKGEPAADVAGVARLQICRAVAAIAFLVGPCAVVLGIMRGTTWMAIVVVAGVWASVNTVSMLYLAMLGGQRRMARVAAAQISSALLYAVGVAALLISDRAIVVGVVGAAAASTALLALVSYQHYGSATRRPSGAEWRRARRIGLPAMLGELANLGLARLDFIAVGALMSSAAVGHYAVAASIAELLWIIPNGVTQVLLPQVATNQRGNATASLVFLTTALGIAGAIVLSVAGFALIPAAFGDSFGPASDALPWLCGAAVALGGWRLLLADLAGRGVTRVRITTALVAIGTMLALDAALVPRWGLAGAGAASLVAYLVAFVLTIRVWTNTAGASSRELLNARSAWSQLVTSIRRLSRPAPD